MAQNAAGQRVYLLSDGLGSIRQVISGTTLVSQRDFDPYGNPTSVTAFSDPYGFSGEWWEKDVKLLHLRARWYDSGNGVFLSKDPWPGDEQRPQSLNGWNYVEGNPVNRTDPSGRCIVQWSGEVRMGQAPYGTSGLCPHTESPHSEAAHEITTLTNKPGFGDDPSRVPAIIIGTSLLLGGPAISAGYSATELAIYSVSARCLLNPVCAALVYGVCSQALNNANTSALNSTNITARLQSLANQATQEVDSMGAAAYSDAQL